MAELSRKEGFFSQSEVFKLEQMLESCSKLNFQEGIVYEYNTSIL